MRFCHTDLGAVAYRWSRLVQEGRRFGDLNAVGRALLPAKLLILRRCFASSKSRMPASRFGNLTFDAESIRSSSGAASALASWHQSSWPCGGARAMASTRNFYEFACERACSAATQGSQARTRS